MPIRYHPGQGSIVTVDFSNGFKNPEMDKKRLAVVLTPHIKSRPQLCTIVPLSLTTPRKIMPYHCELDIPFELPLSWGAHTRWIKGDMVNAVGFHRIEMLRLSKNLEGKRIYQIEVLPSPLMAKVKACVLHGLGMSALTKHLK